MSYAFWMKALKGEPVEIHENSPQPGYYRMRQGKGWPWVPVSLWYPSAEEPLVMLKGTEEILEPARISEVWTYCCRNPISYQAWLDAMDGRGFADEIAEPSRNANADPLTVLSETIEDLVAQASRDLEGADLVADGDRRAKIANYATRLTELAKEADEARVAEKEPHLKAGREVDAKWKPVHERAKDAARTLKDRVGEALVAIKQAAAATGVEVATKAGTRGKSVALRTRKVTKVTDYPALLAHYGCASADPRLHKIPEFNRALVNLATLDLEAGQVVAGAAIATEEYAA